MNHDIDRLHRLVLDGDTQAHLPLARACLRTGMWFALEDCPAHVLYQAAPHAFANNALRLSEGWRRRAAHALLDGEPRAELASRDVTLTVALLRKEAARALLWKRGPFAGLKLGLGSLVWKLWELRCADRAVQAQTWPEDDLIDTTLCAAIESARLRLFGALVPPLHLDWPRMYPWSRTTGRGHAVRTACLALEMNEQQRTGKHARAALCMATAPEDYEVHYEYAGAGAAAFGWTEAAQAFDIEHQTQKRTLIEVALGVYTEPTSQE